ncbi:DNA-binding protein [Methylogaea oryzae]|uniref:DNA-binding protein n=1 Tax=Methylogaea oryzae TaxID=1295382 RepID=A0A8D4VM52_9GAMM|nr:DNA-binding protein [Methylogaea oryzae]BBL70370.1 hypothetical protein MoryE10_09760 [Methylogaea oryzae]
MSKANPAATAAQTDPLRAFINTHGGAITPDQFRAFIASQGVTMADWARERGYTPREVSQVLNGQIKGRYGKSFAIAVAMGLKPAPARALEQCAA